MDNTNGAGIELIVVDLDGTAVNSRGVVEDSTLEEFEAYRKRGAKIVVATGRSPRGAAAPMAQIRPDACILSGGAHIELGGRTYADFRVDSEIAWSIIEAYKRRGCTQFVLTLPDVSYISEELSISDGSFHIRSFHERFEGEIIELSCNWADAGLEAEVLLLDSDLEITRYSEENWRRYAHREANKGTALELVMEHFGVSPEKVIAFGDDYNDISMFSKVGYSVAMSNASDEVKTHAKYRCGSNNEHGIAEFLRALR